MRKFPFIDALRGLAILGVVYVHAGLWGEPASSWLIRFAVNGRRGVQLFFVVSALTLFLSMDNRRKREKNPIRNFFIRRFFRIAPLFYCGIIAYTLIDGFSPRYGAPDGIEWWYLPLTALFINGWSPETITSVVPGGWAIAVEMTFYLVFPLLYRRLHSIGATLCFVGAALVFDFVLSSTSIRRANRHWWMISFICGFLRNSRLLVWVFSLIIFSGGSKFAWIAGRALFLFFFPSTSLFFCLN